MGKIYNLEKVRKIFEEQRCELLEADYINAKTKMKYKCSCGNINEKSLRNFNMRPRCDECGRKRKAEKLRFSFEYVDNYFKEQKCELLEESYINCMTLMKYKCLCGNIGKITLERFRRGQRCNKCSIKRRADKRRHSFEDVYNYFKDNSCELLEKEYIDANHPMRYICSCGNVSKIRFSSFQQGARCKKCGDKKVAEKNRLSFKDVEQYFKEQGCKLLEKKYKNCDTSMRYECSCGRVCRISFHSFKRGNRCKKCGDKKGAEKNRYSYSYVCDYFKEQGCRLLEKEYINSHTPVKYMCSCKNISKISFDSFKRGHRCNKCASERNSGKNSCHYNFNLTDEERIDRRKISGYTDWTKKVYTKDNYFCQRCFQRGGKINAHHIDGYAENENLRLDINNGITLCKSCHMKFHSIYGKKNVNRQQIHEFLKLE